MKLKNLFLAAMTLFAFAACTETPDAPYDFPGTGGGSGSGNTTTNGYPYISETFSTSLGAFKTTETVGNFAWKHETYNGNGYAKVSGYANGASQNAESWLIAPAIDLTNETKAYISFDYVINKGEASAAATNHKVVVTDNYTGDVKTTEWTEIDFRATNNGSWAFNSTGKIALPTEMIGKNSVVIAFKYISSPATSSTWEMNNLLVDGEVGADEAPSTDEDEPTIEGDNLLANSDFETWENGVPTGWAQTVTNCTYTQSTEAHSGSSAVVIEGYSQSNKRFASKSYTLKPGTYTIGAYLKKSGDAFGQYRLGYAKLTNGVVADTQNDYIYITSAAQVPAEWNRATCSFTVNEETEVGIIIMNSKYGEGASILVDDVTLTTTDGGLVEGTDEPETPESGSIFAETFKSSLGKFSTQQTVGDFAWKHETYNGNGYAKVSGYADGASQDAESWLISPAINLSGINDAYISFDYVINKGDASLAASNHQLVVTDNYTGDVATTEWITVPFGAYNDNTWGFKNTGKIALPEAIMSKENVVIAFKYNSTTANSSTWEMNNLVVASGTGETPEQPEEPENPETPDTPEGISTIADVISSGEGTTAAVQGTIVATYARGFIVKDNTASILVYLNEDKGFVEGDVVTVSGTVSMYGGLPQFPQESTVEKTGTATVEHPTATTWTGADLDAYLNDPAIKYVEYTGTLTINGTYYNIEVEGASTAVGSIQYPKDGVVNAASGSVVKVTGYAIGVSGTKYVSTMAVKVETVDGGETPEEPEEPEEPETPATEAGVFDFTNPEALTPAYNRAEVPAGSTSGAGTDITDGETFTNGNLSIKFENGSATTNTRFWTKTGGDVEVRAYKGSTITVSVSEGTMSSIVFTGNKVSTMSADNGSFDKGTWSGDASSVTFSVTGTLNIQTITVK